MSAFEDACKVEAEGLDDVVRFLDQQSDSGHFVLTYKGNLSKFLQETVGDALFNDTQQKIWAVEFKIEQHHTGNVFLETWSNLSRRNPGWMIKVNADILLYYFLDVKRLYTFNFHRLVKWAFGDSTQWTNGEQPAHSPGSIYDFPEKKQRKYTQRNDTWGRVVPLEALRHTVGFQEYTMQQDNSAMNGPAPAPARIKGEQIRMF